MEPEVGRMEARMWAATWVRGVCVCVCVCVQVSQRVEAASDGRTDVCCNAGATSVCTSEATWMYRMEEWRWAATQVRCVCVCTSEAAWMCRMEERMWTATQVNGCVQVRWHGREDVRGMWLHQIYGTDLSVLGRLWLLCVFDSVFDKELHGDGVVFLDLEPHLDSLSLFWLRLHRLWVCYWISASACFALVSIYRPCYGRAVGHKNQVVRVSRARLFRKHA
eukprot:1188931-Prorocentrum_minimum.AAC.1